MIIERYSNKSLEFCDCEQHAYTMSGSCLQNRDAGSGSLNFEAPITRNMYADNSRASHRYFEGLYALSFI